MMYLHSNKTITKIGIFCWPIVVMKGENEGQGWTGERGKNIPGGEGKRAFQGERGKGYSRRRGRKK